MPWRICFTISSGKPGSLPGQLLIPKEICIDIPVIIPKIPTDDWIKSDLLKPRLVKDLQILANIDTLAEGLSPSLKRKIQEASRSSIDAKQELPSEMKINFGKR